jgi:cyclopropane fatty-acyl-phospholipid synthase-like methyltransferase
MADAPAARLAAVIHELVRAHAAKTPAPRGLPYLGLEHASGTGFHLLDALAARGIFRKYELVLDLGAGLGASSRWLASRLGCEVVGTTADPAEATAAAFLTRRAGLANQVRFATARVALPFRRGGFTHVWILEALPMFAAVDAVLAEAYQALRRGGTLAVQDLVMEGHGGDFPPGWRPATLDARVAALTRAGFTDLEVRDRSSEAADTSAQVLALRGRLLQRLRDEPVLRDYLGLRETLAANLAVGNLRVAQLLARRP